MQLTLLPLVGAMMTVRAFQKAHGLKVLLPLVGTMMT